MPPPPPPLISDHHNKHICRSLPLHFLPYSYIVVKLIDFYVMTTVQEHCSLHALKCIAGAESVRPINELHLISTPILLLLLINIFTYNDHPQRQRNRPNKMHICFTTLMIMILPVQQVHWLINKHDKSNDFGKINDRLYGDF